MVNETTRTDVVVVGGGLGGLACALAVARRGRRVVLLEAAARLGGRGASEHDEGFVFNQGPHALFEPSRAMLDSLGVRPSAHVVAGDASFVDDGERLHVLPAGVGSFFGTTYLDARDRLSIGALLPTLLGARTRDEVTFASWLDARAPTPRTRALVEMLARVATYGADPSRASAPSVIAQLRAAAIGGVRYVDGGWATIVSALEEAARAAGVEIVPRARARAIELSPRRVVVRTESRELEASEVVLAGPASLATSLLAPLGTKVVDAVSPGGPGVRVACLDLGLARLPGGACKSAFGTREPTYVSVHSATAALAPEGAAVVHAALYLGERSPEPRADRAAIEAALDRAMPGWRSHVVTERFAPAALAASAQVDAPRGLCARPATTVAPLTNESRGVHLVGDWVGPRGLLLDAVLASALEVARTIDARASRPVSPSLSA